MIRSLFTIILILIFYAFLWGQAQWPERDFALFFAADRYKGLSDLNSSANNAEKISELLESKFGFQTQVIMDPTYDMIWDTLEAYSERFRTPADEGYPPAGQLLIYFSGYGRYRSANGYFLPTDADTNRLSRTALPFSILLPKINRINCQHILVVVDANQSAQFDPDRSRSRFQRPGELGPVEKLIANHRENKARFLFASTPEDLTPDQSRFGVQFINALKKGGINDAILTSTELFSVLEQNEHKPYRGDFGDDEPGSSFLFFEKSFESFTPQQNEPVSVPTPLSRDTIQLDPAPVVLSRHSGIKVLEKDGMVIIRRSWFHWTNIILFLFSGLFFLGAASVLFEELDIKSFLFALVFTCIPGLMLYYSIGGFINKTDLIIGDTQLTIKSYPLPDFSKKYVNRKIDLQSIKQLYTGSEVYQSQKGSSVIYKLFMINTGGEHHLLLGGFVSERKARYLEQVLERELGIEHYELDVLE